MRRALMTTVLFLAFPAASQAATVKVVECVARARPGRPHRDVRGARAPGAAAASGCRSGSRLQARDEGMRTWRRVDAAGFDTWLTSLEGVRRYTYAKTVINLSAPAAYRTVVRFRWLDADGEVVKSSRVTSENCRQPDMRPDLVPRRVDVLPGPDADTRRYAVVVRNGGRTDAGPFGLTLSLAGEPPLPLAVPGLVAGDPADRDVHRPGLRRRVAADGRCGPGRSGGRA